MAHRVFIDDLGIEWQVWETTPSSAERRLRGERRQSARGPLPGLPDRRAGADRRRVAEARVRVTAGYERGWLTFESRGEKRRLMPVPAGWEHLSEAALAELCALATPVPKRFGRLIE